VLACLGVETVGLGMFAGKTGQELLEWSRLMVSSPIRCGWAARRAAHVIVETLHNRHSHIIAGELQVAPEHVEQILERFRQRVRGFLRDLRGSIQRRPPGPVRPHGRGGVSLQRAGADRFGRAPISRRSPIARRC
jgi:hypothetical protein